MDCGVEGELRPVRGGRTRRLALLAGLLLLAGAAAAAALVTTGRHTTPAPVSHDRPGAWLARAVGAAGGARAARTAGVRVALTPHGYSVARRSGSQVSISSTVAGAGPWRAHRRGSVRSTPFGTETIVVGSTRSELFSTVDRHLGVRTWSWRLGATSRPQPDGHGGFTVGGQGGVHLLPLSIVDAYGAAVTPAGARWRLAHDGHGWLLRLRLDDRSLPVPYTIDPAADYPATMYLSTTASGDITAISTNADYSSPTSITPDTLASAPITGQGTLATTEIQNDGAGSNSTLYGSDTFSDTAANRGGTTTTTTKCNGTPNTGQTGTWGLSELPYQTLPNHAGATWTTESDSTTTTCYLTGSGAAVIKGAAMVNGVSYLGSGSDVDEQATVTESAPSLSTTSAATVAGGLVARFPAGRWNKASNTVGQNYYLADIMVSSYVVGISSSTGGQGSVSSQTGKCAAASLTAPEACLRIWRKDAGTSYLALVDLGPASAVLGTPMKIRFVVQEQNGATVLQAKTWQADQPEPVDSSGNAWGSGTFSGTGVWGITAPYTDTTSIRPASGAFGVFGGGFSNTTGPATMTFDDFQAIPLTNASGFWQFVPGGTNTTRLGTLDTSTDGKNIFNGKGWLIDPAVSSWGRTGFPGGTWTLKTVRTSPSGSSFNAGSARLDLVVWKVDCKTTTTACDGATIKNTQLVSGSPFVGTAQLRQAGTTTGTATWTLPAITLAANQTLYFQIYREQQEDLNSVTQANSDISLLTDDGSSHYSELDLQSADSTPPTVSITSPGNNSTLRTNNGNVTLSATASDTNGVSGVNFLYCDATASPGCDPTAGTSIGAASLTAGTSTSGTWTVSWDAGAIPNGDQLKIAAVGTDAFGNTNTSSTSPAAAVSTVAVDNTPPVVSSYSLDTTGTKLDITYNEDLSTSSTPATSDFPVSVNGSDDSVSGVAYSGSRTVELTLAAPAYQGDSVTVAYNGSAIADLAGNPAATYGATSVTNNSTLGPPSAPTLLSPTAGASLNTSRPTLSGAFQDSTATTGKLTFYVCTTSTCAVPTDASFHFDSTTTSLNPGDTGSAQVPQANALPDGQYWWFAQGTDANGRTGPSSSSRAFTVDTTAPTVSSRAVNGSTLDITYGEALDNTSAPANGDFAVSVDGSPDAVTNVAFTNGNATVELTLTAATHFADTVTVAYSGTAIRDIAGNQAAQYGATAVTNNTADVAPNAPAAGAPDGVTLNQTRPTLHATFSDSDPADTGTVTFYVCTTLSCALPADATFSFSSATVSNTSDASTQVPAPNALADGTYWWFARATDSGNQTSISSATHTFTVDTVAPAATIVFPVDGHAYNAGGWTGEITGTATDAAGSGVNAVAVSVEKGGNANECWSGSAFDQPCPNFRPAANDVASGSSTANWSLALGSGDLADGSTYAITVETTDGVGNTSNDAAPATSFTYDTTPPATTIIAPGDGGFYSPNTYPTPWSGTATDNVSVAHVKLELVDTTSSTWWNGATWQTGSPQPVDANGTGPWTYTPPTTLQLTDKDHYTVTVYAVDTADNDNSSAPSTASFTYYNDTTAPTSAISFPASSTITPTTWTNNGATSVCSAANPGICGTVTDDDSGVTAGAAKTEVAIDDTTSHKYWSGTGFTVADTNPEPFQTASLSAGSWDYDLSAGDLTAGHTYTIDVRSTDAVGNVETPVSYSFTFGDDRTPPATTITSTGTHSYLKSTGANAYTLYFNPALVSGGPESFTIADSATDASGIDHVTFPNLTSAGNGFSGSGTSVTSNISGDTPYDAHADYTFSSSATAIADQTVTTVDASSNANPTTDTIHFAVDDTPPQDGVLTAPAYSGSLSVTLTESDFTDADSGLASGSNTITRTQHAPASPGVCPTDPSVYTNPTTVLASDTVPTDGLCYTYTLSATDNVGNKSSVSTTVLVDTTPPSTPTVTFSGLSAHDTYDAGNGTLFFRPSDGGTFTVNAASSDGESGLMAGNLGYTFGLAGTWPSTNQTGGQEVVTFDHSTGDPGGSSTVHATNNAGLNSTDATFTVKADSTAPTSGITCDGVASCPGTANGWYTDGDPNGVDVVISAADETGGSGIDRIVYSTDGTDPSIDANDNVTHGTAVVGGTAEIHWDTLGVTTFKWVAEDNVGNVSTVQSQVVKLDNTPPSNPTTFAFSSLIHAYDNGTTLFFQSGGSGGFTVVPSGAADPESGVASYNFPDLGTGWSWSRTDSDTAVYSFASGATADAAGSVTARNGANLDSSPGLSLSATADGSAPSSSISCNGAGCSSGWYTTSPVAISLGADDGAGSGVERIVYTTDGTDPSIDGTDDSVANGTVATGSFTISTLGTTTVKWIAEDNVGNVSTVQSQQVKLDTTPPTGGSLTYLDGVTSLNAVAVDVTDAADPDSGVTNTVEQATASYDAGSDTCSSFGSFSSVADPSNVPVSAGTCYEFELVATNGAGMSVTRTSSSVVRVTSASPIELAGSLSGSSLQGSTLWLGPDAANQGFSLQLTTEGQAGVTDASWSASSGALTGDGDASGPVATAPFASDTYTWDGSSNLDTTVSVTPDPAPTPVTLAVKSDTSGPSGSITYADGLASSTNVAVGVSASDGQSHLDSSRTQLQRNDAPFDGTSCGTYTGWHDITLSGGVDSVGDNACYQYQAIVYDRVGNSSTLTSSHVVEVPDLTPPTISSASTNSAGTQLTIAMTKTIAACPSTPGSAFTVKYGSTAVTPTTVSCSGTDANVVLGLPAPGPDNSQAVTVSYSAAAAGGNGLTDTNTSPLAASSFGPTSVTNQTKDTVAPALKNASANGGTVTLTFSEALATVAPSAASFVVRLGGIPTTVTAVSTSGSTLTLTISPAAVGGQPISVTYTPPLLNPLEDSSPLASPPNQVEPFTASVTNTSPAAPTTTTTTTTTPATPPSLTGAAPADGSTVSSLSALTLTASTFANWSGVQVGQPDGSTTPFPDKSGTSATWQFAPTETGLYTVSGTITDNASGTSAQFVTHFTLFAPTSSGSGGGGGGSGSGGGTAPPPVQATASPTQPGTLTSADGTATITWPAGAFGDAVIVQLAPPPPSVLSGLPPNSIVVDVTAWVASTHAPVTQFGGVVEIQFPHAPAGAQPRVSSDGTSWRDVPQLTGTTLPDGQPDGWYRDAGDTVHVLTRHLTYYALSAQSAQTKLVLRVASAQRLWTRHRSFVAVRVDLTAPARVTSWFANGRGQILAGTQRRTPTLRAGVTILRLHLPRVSPGSYRIQLRADGIGQTAARTAKLHVLRTRPRTPLLAAGGRVGVVVVQGTPGAARLAGALGSRFAVRRTLESLLFTAVDPRVTSTAGVVLDLDAVPLPVVAGLHAVYPELRIVGVTGHAGTATAARRAGVVVERKPAAATALARALRRLFPPRR